LSSAARGCSQASDNQKSWNRWGFQFRAGDSLAAARPQRRTSSRRRIRPSASARVPSPVPLVLYSFNFSRSSPVEINPELPYFHLFSRTSGTSETHSHLRPLSTRQIRIHSSHPHHPTWPTPPASTSTNSRPRPPLARSTPREIPGPDSTIR
jgi:hypothetical protein